MHKTSFGLLRLISFILIEQDNAYKFTLVSMRQWLIFNCSPPSYNWVRHIVYMANLVKVYITVVCGETGWGVQILVINNC